MANILDRLYCSIMGWLDDHLEQFMAAGTIVVYLAMLFAIIMYVANH